MSNSHRVLLLSLAIVVLLTCTSLAQQGQAPSVEPGDESQKAYLHGRQLAEQGRFDEAAAEFVNAAALKNGKCVECYQMLGFVNLQAAKFSQAERAYRQAIQLKPANEAELHNALGVTLFLQNDKTLFDSAVAEFKQAIDMSEGRIVKAYYNLGHALIKAGRNSEAKEAFKTYLKKEPNASEAAEVRALIADPKKAGVPFAPLFNVKGSDGKELSLEKLKGKVVLLDFWASWCEPCREDMPEIRKIWKKYSGDQFVIIGINLDRNEKKFQAYVKEEEVTWPQYFDGRGWDNKVSRLYGVNAIPQSVLIDRNGVVMQVGLRGPELSDAIGELLKK